MLRTKIVMAVVGLILLASPHARGDVYLDADTVNTGSQLDTSPLTVKPWGTWGPDGTVTFYGKITDAWTDADFIAAGASGNMFNVTESSGQNEAQLMFDFDVEEIEFIFGGGGNSPNAMLEIVALDSLGQEIIGSGGTFNTWQNQPAGPLAIQAQLFWPSIRGIKWLDLPSGDRFGALDNITITPVPLSGFSPVPEPSTYILLLSAGGMLAGLGWLRRKRAA